MGGWSLGAPTCLAEAVALAWHGPGGALPPAYQWRRRSLRARAPEQHSRTPSRAISAHARFEPCEACCEQAVAGWSLGAPTCLAEAVALAWHGLGTHIRTTRSNLGSPFCCFRCIHGFYARLSQRCCQTHQRASAWQCGARGKQKSPALASRRSSGLVSHSGWAPLAISSWRRSSALARFSAAAACTASAMACVHAQSRWHCLAQSTWDRPRPKWRRSANPACPWKQHAGCEKRAPPHSHTTVHSAGVRCRWRQGSA